MYPGYNKIKVIFEWDDDKNKINQQKHGVSFEEARLAFFDAHRIIAKDLEHSEYEQRFYCLGKTNKGILTVRFTYRAHIIRLIGAGFWRKGRKIYEETQKSKIH